MENLELTTNWWQIVSFITKSLASNIFFMGHETHWGMFMVQRLYRNFCSNLIIYSFDVWGLVYAKTKTGKKIKVHHLHWTFGPYSTQMLLICVACCSHPTHKGPEQAWYAAACLCAGEDICFACWATWVQRSCASDCACHPMQIALNLHCILLWWWCLPNLLDLVRRKWRSRIWKNSLYLNYK